MFRQISRVGGIFARRRFSTTSVRRTDNQDWQQYGIAGANLPFDISNRYKMTGIACIFFATGFNAPFILVVHTYAKNRQTLD